ncbi:phosphate signaling complex protein PhoU [Saxibacter everestensis]|uniref:Phosphate-specific transport system accessory protein PhoU n=1 Tax=Saxibacter everestensis TaxID=2909229 RepID=A0ABY8QVV9_9MICO|nr:phosphate signaling complex protein PhoU [Brevibacteriaceae bacterium ZFBP1038]
MREVFRQDLQQIADLLTQMATLVRSAIGNANQALNQVDLQLAERVIEEDVRIDELQQELDELAINVLARQAPVAGDLRNVVAALRMSASVERMGDLARHVAQLVRIRYPEHAIPEQVRPIFVEMGQYAEKIADATIELLESRGLDQVPAINEVDEKLDDLHRSVFQAVAANWDGSGESAIDVALASRYYERFGDHAVSVSKKVEYLLTGDW